jgi:plastocyanin
MAHTDITLKIADSVFVPSQSQVSVVKGDTVTFSTSDDRKVAIFFSPGAVSVLSPAPAVPTVLDAGKKAEFSFTSSDAGAYSVFFERDAASAPAHFPSRKSNHLLLEIDSSGGGFGGPSDPIKSKTGG